MTIKFNVEPYYDDFETATPAVDGLTPKEKYNRVLFRPGHAVQARELTQLQSILQNQVTQVSNNLFKEGSMVIPGHTTIEPSIDYVKLSAVSGTPAQLEGLTFTNSAGLTARVVHSVVADGGDAATLFLKYTNSGSGGESVFASAEALTTSPAAYTATVFDTADLAVGDADVVGLGSIATVQDGIYFIKGHMVVVKAATIILDKYVANPSYDIGLEINESVETSQGDESLNDNANGTPNYAAPGAHRYKISTKLVKQAIDATGTAEADNFLLLIRVDEGGTSTHVRATDYAIIEDTLARRTFDESGNYAVRPFVMDINEHTAVNNVATGDASKISLGMEPSKAYVSGYEIETLSTTQLATNKARDSALFEAASVPVPIGNYIVVNNLTGLPDITNFAAVQLKNVTTTGAGTTGGSGTIIGSARVRTIVYNGSNTYNLYLFDIKMNSGKVFDNVKSLYTAGSPAFDATVVLESSKAIIKDTGRSTLVFDTPFDRVKTCDSSADNVADDFNYLYFCNRKFSAQTVGGSGSVAFTTIGDKEQFEPLDSENWILAAADGTIITIPSLTITGANTVGAPAIATITGLTAYNNTNVTLIAGVHRSLGHKTKTVGASATFAIASPTADMQLDKADGYRLLNVYMSPSSGVPATAAHEDVTEYYDFDDGQRDNFYSIARLKLKSNTAFVPTGRLMVSYEYFIHSAQGDFFSVDSYPSTVAYEDIPLFNSNSLGQTIELRSAIDFRPRESDTGGDFTGTGGVVSICPEPQTTFTTDIQYYLNRVDKVFIDSKGDFGVVEGVSAVDPQLPEDPKDTMVLYTVFMKAYTEGPSEVIPTMIDNKRYTMRDIGRIEKRVNNLEYYTALSLLEKDAEGRQIIDSSTGIQRVKSGFIVDSFATHSVGDVTNAEYRSAIDRDNHELRSMFASDNVNLKYSAAATPAVVKTGDLITLPFTEVKLINQAQASAWINVNPYEVFSWVGRLELSPSSDEWRDTTRRPALVIDQEGVYDAMMGIINETDSLGTVWNEWQTTWTGKPNSKSVTTKSGRKTTVTTTKAWQIGEGRTGVKTAVTPDTITTAIGDRVVEVNFAPFMRSRIVNFKGTRLKPSTQVYAFFDGVDVSAFVREETAYTLYSDTDNSILTGKNTVTAHPDGATALTTDANGEVIGSFFIPNNLVNAFKTGTKLFKLTDSATDSISNTSSEENYSAKGLIATKENVTISTRVPLIERSEVPDNRIVDRSTTSNSVSWESRKSNPSNNNNKIVNTKGTSIWTDGSGNPIRSGVTGKAIRTNTQCRRYLDPLAQSFMIDTYGGAFITSIDLFFHTKDTSEPISVQIREMKNGIPTHNVLPFAWTTLKPADVNVVDLTTVNPNPNVTPTRFTFESPVFLQEHTEYCFVIMANSTDYNVWYAGTGENDYVTNKRISKQPYAGVMFKSQNASTWSPDQNKDIKFKINRAEFDITGTGIVDLVNGAVAPRKLVKHAMTSTSGSKIIIVEHPNHHFFNTTNTVTSKVTISGAVNFNGLTTINGTHTVYDVEMDRYKINLSGSSNASGTGIGGGANIVATQNQLINTFMPFVQSLNFAGTNSNWGIALSSGMSLGAIAPTPYALTDTFAPVIINQNSSINIPKVIASADNAAAHSVILRGTLTSTMTNLSPVIDMERCSLITVANRIDNSEAIAGTDSTKNNVENFVAETAATGGSAKSKYVTKSVTLGSASEGLHVYLDTNRPSATHIDVYYKVSDSEDTLNAELWTLANPVESIPFTDSGLFSETEYVIDPAGTFTAFKLKIVSRSSNSSRIPKCKDLRVIAILP